jgi:hypothetical protein
MLREEFTGEFGREPVIWWTRAGGGVKKESVRGEE